MAQTLFFNNNSPNKNGLTNKGLGPESTRLNTEASKLIHQIIADLLSNKLDTESDSFKFKLNKLALAYLQQGNITSTKVLSTITLSTKDLETILLENLDFSQINDETLGHTINTFGNALFFRVASPRDYPGLECIAPELLQKNAIAIFDIYYEKVIDAFKSICTRYIDSFRPMDIDGITIVEIKSRMREDLQELLDAMVFHKARSSSLLEGALLYEM